jgi:hypothetical protein
VFSSYAKNVFFSCSKHERATAAGQEWRQPAQRIVPEGESKTHLCSLRLEENSAAKVVGTNFSYHPVNALLRRLIQFSLLGQSDDESGNAGLWRKLPLCGKMTNGPFWAVPG